MYIFIKFKCVLNLIKTYRGLYNNHVSKFHKQIIFIKFYLTICK